MNNNSKRNQEVAISAMLCKLCKEQGGSIHDAKRFLAYIKSFRFASYFNSAIKGGDSEVQALVFALAKCQDDTISKVERNTTNLNYLSKTTFQAIRANQ